MSEVIRPIGSSFGAATVRAKVSATRRMPAPMTPEPIMSGRAVGPIKYRVMCGAASAKNAIVPTALTAVATRIEMTINAENLIARGLCPK